jgi:radical SAM protein with 4Fe4S-binding SPASM domain
VNQKEILNKSNPRIINQFLIMKHNQHELEDIKKLSTKMKVDDIRCSLIYANTTEEIEKYIPNDPKLNIYNEVKGKEFELKVLKNDCNRLWKSVVFTWEGEMVVCCCDKDNYIKVGNINDISFEKLWKSKQFREFRGGVLKNRKQFSICRICY